MYRPLYSITDELLNTISFIESIRSDVGASRILPTREIELRHRATIEATHSSTSIEGNPLTIKQVEKALASTRTLTRHQYAEQEVRNYKKALDFISKRKDSHEPIGVSDLLRIHKLATDLLLPSEKTGVFRTGKVYIEDQNKKVVYTGPDAKLIDNEIDDLIIWLKAEANGIHPVLAAAILHFHFVSIHPFADGNGRTTRLLTMLYLGTRDYDFRGSIVLDSYYSVDRPEYYRSLDVANSYAGRKKAQINPWIHYFVNGFLSAAKVLQVEVTILRSLIGTDSTLALTKDESDLLGYAKQFGSLGIAEAEDVLAGIPRRTVQRKLKRLVDHGYLEATDATKGRRYIFKATK